MPRRSILIAILFAVVIAVAMFYRTKPQPAPANLMPIGTNTPAIGAMIYDPHSGQPRGEVLDVRTAHEFPDGAISPAVLVRSVNGAVVWTPRENLNKALVAH